MPAFSVFMRGSWVPALKKGVVLHAALLRDGDDVRAVAVECASIAAGLCVRNPVQLIAAKPRRECLNPASGLLLGRALVGEDIPGKALGLRRQSRGVVRTASAPHNDDGDYHVGEDQPRDSPSPHAVSLKRQILGSSTMTAMLRDGRWYPARAAVGPFVGVLIADAVLHHDVWPMGLIVAVPAAVAAWICGWVWVAMRGRPS
jgi:hypothetical protein